ncbi:hypothetical protein L3Q82_022511 [Scortum barcoo]|uniref:Uncharacterized protein n=1 Tax=Scortum barcoo TaxID=214431 RepID=A0ACB8X4T0_9TELE|nr:hypothetical protein L3Q82_022511 [Scortum barcoo]
MLLPSGHNFHSDWGTDTGAVEAPRLEAPPLEGARRCASAGWRWRGGETPPTPEYCCLSLWPAKDDMSSVRGRADRSLTLITKQTGYKAGHQCISDHTSLTVCKNKNSTITGELSLMRPERDKKRLNRLIKRASSVCGCPLDSIEVMGERRALAKLSTYHGQHLPPSA